MTLTSSHAPAEPPRTHNSYSLLPLTHYPAPQPVSLIPCLKSHILSASIVQKFALHPSVAQYDTYHPSYLPPTVQTFVPTPLGAVPPAFSTLDGRLPPPPPRPPSTCLPACFTYSSLQPPNYVGVRAEPLTLTQTLSRFFRCFVLPRWRFRSDPSHAVFHLPLAPLACRCHICKLRPTNPHMYLCSQSRFPPASLALCISHFLSRV